MSAPRRALPPRRAAQVARRGPRPVLAVVGLFMVTIAFAGVGSWSLVQALAPTPVTADPIRGWDLAQQPAEAATAPAGSVADPTYDPDDVYQDDIDQAEGQSSSAESVDEAPSSLPPPETSTDPAATSDARLVIAQLKVEASIDVVGTQAGELLVPPELDRVGLWQGGAQLADAQGTVLVAGHLAIGEQRGVGFRWSELSPGAEVITIDEHGVYQRWRAISLDVYDGYELPTELFNRTGPRRLALVTCSGPVVTVDGRREYRDNVVIIAEPID